MLILAGAAHVSVVSGWVGWGQLVLAAMTALPVCTASFLTGGECFHGGGHALRKLVSQSHKRTSGNTHVVSRLCVHHIFRNTSRAKASHMPTPRIREDGAEVWIQEGP